MGKLITLALAAAMLAAGPLAAQDVAPDGFEDHPIEFYHNDGEDLPPSPTRVISLDDLNRIAAPKGMTLQWIDGPQRGQVRVLVDGEGVWRMMGSHNGPDGAYVGVDGLITEVGTNYFMLTGKVAIENTPDGGRRCEAMANWRFEITQNRKYYRLRQFEWCDYLTDYIDIHF